MSSEDLKIENSLMTLEESLKSTSGILIGSADGFGFSSVATDSRNVSTGTLFVPLVGENQDGHKFIPEAIERGAKVIMINNSEYKKNVSLYEKLSADGHKFIAVENTLYGLQELAEGYVEKFPKLVKIAITGSSGKTTTKEMIVSVLKQKYNCVYTEGNLNSETGLPLSVFKIRREHECGIFEMGMNRVNEIGEISKVLKPQYGIITNIGTAHIGILGSQDNIAEEKRKVFNWISTDGVAFVPKNEKYSDYLISNVIGKIKYFGEGVIEGEKILSDNGIHGTEFLLDGEKINLCLGGSYNFQNALCAVTVGKTLGLTTQQIKNGIESFKNVKGRMEVSKEKLKNGQSVYLVKDYYNANPDSMQKSISLCLSDKKSKDKIFVLGDMKELGGKSFQAHKEIFENILSSEFFAACFIGSEFLKIKNSEDFINLCKNQTKPICFFESVESEGVSDFVLNNSKDDSLVLLKGSNSMKLFDLVPKISVEEGIE